MLSAIGLCGVEVGRYLGQHGGRIAEIVAYRFLGDGQAAARIREIDWRHTCAGDASGWSQSLKSMLGTMTRSRMPMLLLLGADLVQIYNDAYVEQGLSRHPAQMGVPTADTWPEVILLLAEQFADVLKHVTPTVHENSMLQLLRNGRLVDT